MIDTIPAQPTPLTEHIRITDIKQIGDDLSILARVLVDVDNPVLAGHYPGMPIFPGVCLLECAHWTVLLAARSRGFTPVLKAVSTARFTDAVFPGDTVGIQATVTRTESKWRAGVLLHSQRGPAAKATLLYDEPGGAS